MIILLSPTEKECELHPYKRKPVKFLFSACYKHTDSSDCSILSNYRPQVVRNRFGITELVLGVKTSRLLGITTEQLVRRCNVQNAPLGPQQQ